VTASHGEDRRPARDSGRSRARGADGREAGPPRARPGPDPDADPSRARRSLRAEAPRARRCPEQEAAPPGEGPSRPSPGPWGRPPDFAPLPSAARSALADVYARVEAALASAGAACRACGECCRFRPGDVVLFASALEMAYLVGEAGPPPPDRRPEAGPPDGPWRCPYQAGDLCAARAARPLGCRTHFCETEARAEGERVHAAAWPEVRGLAEGARGRWWYGPARAYLARPAPPPEPRA